MSPHEDVTAEQHEVQRLLGRCMLRLQQYEGLMKAILAHHELSGAAHELQARRAERISELSTTSLGNLAKLLFESYVVVRRPDGSPADDNEVDLPASTVATIRTRMTLEMAAEDVVATKAAVKELVNLRNSLVHHLIERFNVWSLEGCAQATAHLVECYGRIDEHFEQLRQWAVSMDEARALAASFMQSDAFQDFVVNGIGPDGVVHWPSAGIVSCLREAVSVGGTDGWTPLEAAIAFMAERHQEQTPHKYGCRSWQQVLHESRAFELQYRGEAGAARTAWYRLRPNR